MSQFDLHCLKSIHLPPSTQHSLPDQGATHSSVQTTPAGETRRTRARPAPRARGLPPQGAEGRARTKSGQAGSWNRLGPLGLASPFVAASFIFPQLQKVYPLQSGLRPAKLGGATVSPSNHPKRDFLKPEIWFLGATLQPDLSTWHQLEWVDWKEYEVPCQIVP